MNRSLLAIAATMATVLPACDAEPASAGGDGGHQTDAGGLGREVPDCNQRQELPCFETIWIDGSARKMTFYDIDVKTNPPSEKFYVTAPQSDTPQGIIPFHHDHAVARGAGEHWHGYLVLCSEAGLTSGACVSPAPQGSPPLAATVHGQRLKTVDAIEVARGAGLVTLFDTGAVLQGRLER